MKNWKISAQIFASFVGAVVLFYLVRFPNQDESNSDSSASSFESRTDRKSANSQPAPGNNRQQPASGNQVLPEENNVVVAVESAPRQTLDITSAVNSGTSLYVSRQLIVTQYGKFILELPLSPAEKQEVRKLMVEVQLHNSILGRRLRNGEITEVEFSEQLQRMDLELAKLLTPDLIDTYRETNTQVRNESRERMASSRDRIAENNLQRISGLTEENREIFLSMLVEASGDQSIQSSYDDSVLFDVRGELADVFDSDQLEVLDIYIESEQVRKGRISTISRGNDDSDQYSSRFLVNARSNVNSNYGAFIRDLPITPAEKMEVRALMVRVTVNNGDLMEAMSSGQASPTDLSGNYLRMETELANILGESGLRAFMDMEQQRLGTLVQASLEGQQKSIEYNLQYISGLSENNRRLFMEAAASIEPQPQMAGHYQPETIQSVREQFVDSFDSDQMEVIDIYVAETIGFKRSVDERTEERRQQRQGN